MDNLDLEIIEYTVGLMRHGMNCGRIGCASCSKLRQIVSVIRGMIFDVDPNALAGAACSKPLSGRSS